MADVKPDIKGDAGDDATPSSSGRKVKLVSMEGEAFEVRAPLMHICMCTHTLAQRQQQQLQQQGANCVGNCRVVDHARCM